MWVIWYVLHQRRGPGVDQCHAVARQHPQANASGRLRHCPKAKRVDDFHGYEEVRALVALNHCKADVGDRLQLKLSAWRASQSHIITLFWEFCCYVLVFFGETSQSLHSNLAHKIEFCRISNNYMRKWYEYTVPVAEIINWNKTSTQHTT